ncbi:bifunctional hydroxymethylpyrimidine kinase/phosphomethylpyrimidine kinase [Leptothoe sp. ISB3NOV94-8A]|uniref:Bifunctional hydroxymethylpyrimidine kinase/phosphomethylpyrimidine kinase n=1 Tax=Adonisia turfae CCMR0081 TaxID=2292702 RepID=A0A6M0RLT1_9CYAN|nr:bifunctional hydroxymethylpyrimidine kinase/phosphomethylpyrimidine kinase [Adonisia turfae]MDV3350817.1 bifunctional hydroxymethylpyrimidine kinase/phosphomethylpyrimidine kinase [Leptothoe sp. LEGE 181152]NEZ57208.1 bifunctional hydroxymethylpyrimidine kinase/phosphomethylpyrimidine kinase [Adonisia turfae CCMR0081]
MAYIPPVALTIAGSDSGGGAGIQADLRTFSFHAVHGTSALTCITAQNTQGVSRVDALAPEAIIAQIEAVFTDMGVQALKTGMLLNQPIIEAVTDYLKGLVDVDCVIDPVMVSRTGAQLIDDNAIAALKKLIPLATVLTPNRYEAEILSGQSIKTLEHMKTAAQAIHGLGAKAVIVKGGGFDNELRGIDVWYDGTTLTKLTTSCIDTADTHGTGCTLSAAITANLALGHTPFEAAKRAKEYVTQALNYSLRIGTGQGPVGHFYPLLT